MTLILIAAVILGLGAKDKIDLIAGGLLLSTITVLSYITA